MSPRVATTRKEGLSPMAPTVIQKRTLSSYNSLVKRGVSPSSSFMQKLLRWLNVGKPPIKSRSSESTRKENSEMQNRARSAPLPSGQQELDL